MRALRTVNRHHAEVPDGGVRGLGSLTLFTEARVRPALPPHIPHQIAHSSGPTGARGRARGASSSAPPDQQGSIATSCSAPIKGQSTAPAPSSEERPGGLDFSSPSIHGWRKDNSASRAPSGLESTAATYTSFVSTSLSVYVDLPGHHLRSTLGLIASPPISSYPEDPTSGDDEWADADFSRCGDPETFMCFLETSNYCLSYSDSNDGGYDPSRECFNLEVGGAPPNAQGGAGPSRQGNATPPPNLTLGIHPAARGAASAPPGGQRPDLEQLSALEARLEEEHVRLRQLRETLVQDPSGCGDGGEARRRARDVNRRIIEDEGGDNPPVFSTASQNVMAAALLLRVMLEPSTPEGRRVRQGL